MKKLLAVGLGLFFCWLSIADAKKAQAQQVNMYCQVSAGPPQVWSPCNSTNPVQVQIAGGSAGGVAVFGPTASGSASANPPVQIGGTTTGAAAQNVAGAAVKPASVTALATDTSLVTQLNPNSPGIIANAVPGTPNTTTVLSVQGETGMTPVQTSASTSPSVANGNGVVIAPSANAGDGITPVVGGSAVSSLVLKNAAGSLYSVYANCTSACWLMVFNAISAPSNGATTAGNAASNMVECISIGAGSVGGLTYGSGPPAVYSTGITATISSTACATLTLSTVGFIHGMVK